MQLLPNYGDDRNQGWCVYCGGSEETRDHVPSRVLLDEPFPEYLPVVPACAGCNGSFSRDEEYLACLVECALKGSVTDAANRPRVGAILGRAAGLAARLNAARYESDGQIGFSAETARVRSVLLKLARGHIAFEQNEPQLTEPSAIALLPLSAMTTEQRRAFETGPADSVLDSPSPEVGSRAMSRLLGDQDTDEAGWITVQPDHYRYRVLYGGGFKVQIVLREYLAAEVTWG